MRDAYHEELDSIGDGLVEMGRLVGSAIGRATTAILDAGEDALRGVGRCRRGLDPELAVVGVVDEDQVGERATDVDADSCHVSSFDM